MLAAGNGRLERRLNFNGRGVGLAGGIELLRVRRRADWDHFDGIGNDAAVGNIGQLDNHGVRRSAVDESAEALPDAPGGMPADSLTAVVPSRLFEETESL